MGIKIYYKDTLIAEENDWKFYPVEGIPANVLPLLMFGGKNEPVPYNKFEFWISSRVVPDSRIDLKNVLKKINLCIYDVLAIGKLTQCRRLPDYYWADWGNLVNPLPIENETEEDIVRREDELKKLHDFYYKGSLYDDL